MKENLVWGKREKVVNWISTDWNVLKMSCGECFDRTAQESLTWEHRGLNSH